MGLGRCCRTPGWRTFATAGYVVRADHRYYASSDFRSALCHFTGAPLIGFAVTGHRRVASCGHDAGAETDLSCSTMGCVIVPIPIRRRVLGCRTSKLFAPSMVFALVVRARLPLLSLHAGDLHDAVSGFLIVRTDHLLAAQGDFVMALQRSGLPFRRPPATGPLGRYPDRTFTGKSTAACRTHTTSRSAGASGDGTRSLTASDRLGHSLSPT
jgi:hypothetical protein